MKVRVLVTSVLLMGMCGTGQSLFAANAAPDEKKQPDAKKEAAGIMCLLDGKEANVDERTLSEAEKKVDQCVGILAKAAALERAKEAASSEALAKLKHEGDVLLAELDTIGLRALKTVIINKFKQPIDLKTPLATYDFSDLNKLPRGGGDWNRAVGAFNGFVVNIRDEKIHLVQLLALIGTFWGPIAFQTISGLMQGDLLSRCIRAPFYESAGTIDAALALKQEAFFWESLVDLVGGTLQYNPNSCPLM